MVVGGLRHARALHPLERNPVPILQKAEWAREPNWTGAKISRP
jgi:hypothetical protein